MQIVNCCSLLRLEVVIGLFKIRNHKTKYIVSRSLVLMRFVVDCSNGGACWNANGELL